MEFKGMIEAVAEQLDDRASVGGNFTWELATVVDGRQQVIQQIHVRNVDNAVTKIYFSKVTAVGGVGTTRTFHTELANAKDDPAEWSGELFLDEGDSLMLDLEGVTNNDRIVMDVLGVEYGEQDIQT